MNTKLQHWRGLQAKKVWKRASNGDLRVLRRTALELYCRDFDKHQTLPPNLS